MEQAKVYFLPGDLVSLRQEIPNKPTMYVVKKATKRITIGGVKNDQFQGILCRWFSTDQKMQEGIFNTKDLTKDVNNAF